MVKCVFCKCRFRKGSNITFHRFPTDPGIRSLWLSNMKAHNWTPSTSARLCSKHFDVKCFYKHYTRTFLLKNSIPTIFERESDVAPSNEAFEPVSNDMCLENEMEVEEQPPVLTYPYECGELARNSPVPLKLHAFRNPEIGSTDESEKENEAFKHDHVYQAPQTPKKRIIELNIMHDHRYENTPKSSKKASERVKKQLKKSQTRVKILLQKVKRLKTKVDCFI